MTANCTRLSINSTTHNQKYVAYWLFGMSVLVAIMVVIGGVTRLTGSGLSMVEWRPVIGTLPPLNAEEWQRVFDLYRATPEYEQLNYGIDLGGFKSIFFWEYFHRLWGRLLGLAFGLPFVFLLVTKRVPRGYNRRLTTLLLLGGFQGVIGWWMVKSGLSEEKTMLDVASYRLAIHLSLALIILSVIYALININRSRSITPLVKISPEKKTSQETLTNIMLVLFFLQVFLGALVSGIDAGLSYSDWPLMNGRVIPEDIFYLNPWHLNFLENPALVQFNHRLMGYCILIFGFVLWVRGTTTGSLNKQKIMKYHSLLFVLVLQVTLGIIAVLMSVPLILGLGHQLVAMLLLLCILNLKFSLSAERKIKAVYS